MSCSIGLAVEREQYVMKLSASLREMSRGSKAWWTKSRELLRMKGKCDGIPALKTDAGAWVMFQGMTNLCFPTPKTVVPNLPYGMTTLCA